jgi:ribosomal protein S18 acetylase RimI-like enzyme
MTSIRPFQPIDEDETIALWRACDLTRPWNDPKKDIARKLRVQPELFLVAIVDGRLVGSVMAGYDGHRGWMYYLGVAPAFRSRGIGRALVGEVENRLRQMGCPKVQLMVRSENVAASGFYQRLAYRRDDLVNLGKRLEVDEPGRTTADG